MKKIFLVLIALLCGCSGATGPKIPGVATTVHASDITLPTIVPTAKPTPRPTPNLTPTYAPANTAKALTVVAKTYTGLRNFTLFSAMAIQQEVANDPAKMNYKNLSTTGKIAVLRRRAMDRNLWTCMFNYPDPILLSDHDITVTANIQ